jgi:hypothetical protein
MGKRSQKEVPSQSQANFGGSTRTAVAMVNVISIRNGPPGYAIITVGTFEPRVPTAAPTPLPATPEPTNPLPTPSPTMFLCNTDADCLQHDYANFPACTEPMFCDMVSGICTEGARLQLRWNLRRSDGWYQKHL